MARIRTIKPEFATSESMGAISRDARLLFVLLWTIVDDVGRTRAASRMLASLLYPYDDDAAAQIEGWLAELEKAGCIRQYEVEGSHYLEIQNWLKHQKIDHPSKSKIPPPGGVFAKPRETLAKPRASRARGLDLDLGPRTMDQEGEDSLTRVLRARAHATTLDWPADWREQIKTTYPNHVAIIPGLGKLDQVRRAGEVSWAVLINGLSRYVETKPADREWVNLERWAREERWNDKPAPPRANGKHERRHVADELAEEARRFENQSGSEAVSVGGAELGGDHAQVVPGNKPT